MTGQGAPTMGFGVRLPGLNLNLPFSSRVLDKWPNSSVSHFPYLLNFHSTYTHPLHETIKKMTGKKKKRKENRHHFVSCQGHGNCSANVASTSQWWLPRSWLHEGASGRVSPPCVLLRALKIIACSFLSVLIIINNKFWTRYSTFSSFTGTHRWSWSCNLNLWSHLAPMSYPGNFVETNLRLSL